MTTVRSVDPTSDPVSYAEAKEHLKLLSDAEKTYVESLISVATDIAEEDCNRSLMPQTWVMYMDSVPSTSELLLPYPPLVSATIAYKDADGDNQTFSSAQYEVDIIPEPGRISLVPDTTGWPTTEAGGINTFAVTYVAGYADAASVPKTIKQAILLYVHHWYEHRVEITTISPMMGQSDLKQTPKAAGFLLFPYRIPAFGKERQ